MPSVSGLLSRAALLKRFWWRACLQAKHGRPGTLWACMKCADTHLSYNTQHLRLHPDACIRSRQQVELCCKAGSTLAESFLSADGSTKWPETWLPFLAMHQDTVGHSRPHAMAARQVTAQVVMLYWGIKRHVLFWTCMLVNHGQYECLSIVGIMVSEVQGVPGHELFWAHVLV